MGICSFYAFEKLGFQEKPDMNLKIEAFVQPLGAYGKTRASIVLSTFADKTACRKSNMAPPPKKKERQRLHKIF